jgi:hypothetical protein
MTPGAKSPKFPLDGIRIFEFGKRIALTVIRRRGVRGRGEGAAVGGRWLILRQANGDLAGVPKLNVLEQPYPHAVRRCRPTRGVLSAGVA